MYKCEYSLFLYRSSQVLKEKVEHANILSWAYCLGPIPPFFWSNFWFFFSAVLWIIVVSILLSTFLPRNKIAAWFSLEEIATWYVPSSDSYSGSTSKSFLITTYPNRTLGTIVCECYAEAGKFFSKSQNSFIEWKIPSLLS